MKLELHYGEYEILGVVIDMIEKCVVNVYSAEDAQDIMDMVDADGYSIVDVVEMVS